MIFNLKSKFIISAKNLENSDNWSEENYIKFDFVLISHLMNQLLIRPIMRKSASQR